MNRSGLWVAVLLLVVLSGSQLGAQDAPLSVTSAVNRSRITIGDLITYTVTVSSREDVKVEMPGLGANLGGFEIRDYQVLEPKTEGDRRVSTYQYSISTFQTGEFEIPPLAIRYALPGQSEPQTISTQSIKIVVESLKPSEAGDIRDVKPPVEIPRDWGRILQWTALGLVLAAAAAAGFVWYRRRRRQPEVAPPCEPSRPAHEVALEALARLEGMTPASRVEVMRYYVDVSQILRVYVEGRWGIDALEMTTEDLLGQLEASGLGGSIVDRFRGLLGRCDVVKFAKYEPPSAWHSEVLAGAREIVTLTLPVTEVPLPLTGGGAAGEPDRPVPKVTVDGGGDLSRERSSNEGAS